MPVEIDSLMKRFEDLNPLAKVGRGPEHPRLPNRSLEKLISQWVDLHPFLLRDPGYLAFLRRYAGADVDVSGRGGVSIAGFTGIGGDLHEVGPLRYDLTKPFVDDRGFYPFASLDVPSDKANATDRVAMDFLLAATQERQMGVYRRMRGGAGEEWYCETFLKWLEKVLMLLEAS